VHHLAPLKIYPLYNLSIGGVSFLIKDDNVRITITIPKTLHRLLKKDANFEDRTVSNLSARILKKYYNLDNEEVD
jgi:hypothetical protein